MLESAVTTPGLTWALVTLGLGTNVRQVHHHG